MVSELSRVVDALPGLVWTAFPDGQIDFLNRRWCEYTGREVDESRGRGWQAAVHPQDLPRLLAAWQPDCSPLAPVETEARLRGSDGKYRWFLFRVQPSADASGRIVKWSGLGTDIDERKQAEEALRASEYRFRLIVDGLPVLLSTATPDGELDKANRHYLEYFGATLEELKAREAVHGLHPDDRDRLLPVREEAIEAGRPYEIEVRRRRADGVYRWFYLRAFPLRDAAGNVALWYRLQIDIEDQKRAEALLAGEKRLLEMVASGRPMPEILDALCRFVESTVSGCYCSIVLLDPSGTQLQEAIAPSIPADFNDSVRGWPLTRVGGPCVTAARDNVQVIMSDVASDTRWRNGWRALAQAKGLRSCWSTPIVSQAGKVLGTFALYQGEPGNPNALQLELIGQFTNIASIAIERAQRDGALRRSEARLAEAERELQLTVDTLPILVATYRPDGSRIFVNRTWRDYTGLSLEEAEQVSVVHPDDAERVAQEWRTSLAAGETLNTEARLRRADGAYRWHAMHRVLTRDDTGAIVKMYNVAVDIEERKRAEEALRDSEQDSRLIVDSVPGLVAVFMPDGGFDFVNRQVVEYFGRTLDELKKRGASRDELHPEDFPRVAELFKQSMASGAPFDFEVRCRRFDGTYRWFQSRGFPLCDANGRIVRWYNLLIDIDERKRVEEALRQSEARLSQAEGDLRLTLDSIPVITWRGGPNGYVEQLNKRWFEYTGSTPEQTRGRRWKSYVHPDDLDPLVEAGARYVAGGTPVDMEARLRRFDGTYRWFLFRPAPARDETGKVIGWYGTIVDIEDRKQAEQKALEAERDLQHLIDHIPTMVATYRGDGLRLSVNKQLRDYIGGVPSGDWQRAIHNQRTAISDMHPDDVEVAENKWHESLATGEPYQTEYRVRRQDGTYRWLMLHRVPVRDETGKVIRWYGAGYEIEDRKRAEEKLRHSEALLAKAQRLSMTGSFSFDPATEEGSWSEEVYRIYEVEPGTRVTLDVVRTRYHPEDLHLLEQQIALIRSGATDLDYEHRLLMPDGSIKHVHMVAHGSRNEDGAIEYIGAVQDVTHRKRAEEELRRSEAFLAKAQRLSLTGSFSFYTATQEFTWSDELYRIFEFEPGVRVTLELIGSRYHPEDRHVMEEVAEGIRRGVPDFDYEHRLLMADGSIKHIRVVAHRTPDKEGSGAEYFGAVQDVTQRRVAEEDLRRSEAYLAEAQRLSHTGSWVVDYVNRKPIHSSEEHHRLFGFDPAEGMPPWRAWMDRIHPEDRPRMKELVERSSREKTDLEMDYRICLPDGTVRYVHDVGHPVLNASGDVVEFVGTSVDVTQRRAAEDALDKVRSELAHVTRAMSLGALTASIAHEVNQPLAGIITNASTCLRMLAADPPNVAGARLTAQRTIRDGNRAADVITRLRALFSKKAAATETVDLTEATREVLALVFSDLLRNRVFLHTELDDDHPLLVTGDRVQLQQVILNLVRNASDAMRDVNDRPRHLLVKLERDDEGGTRLLVRDAGVGIEPQNLERLFDAFYTTKSDGMGIGLSVSRSIIESHGGKLWAEANDGPGTTFLFSIPKIDGATGDRTAETVWIPHINDAHGMMRNP